MSTQSHDEASLLLHQLAQRYLQRPLTDEEQHQLRAFVANWNNQPEVKPALAARQQALQQAEAILRQGLHNAEQEQRRAVNEASALQQRLEQQEKQQLTREEQALIQLLQRANSLNELRPSHLHPGTPGHIDFIMSQVADRLGNLIQQEVAASVGKHFHAMQQQLESKINQETRGLMGQVNELETLLHKVSQQLQERQSTVQADTITFRSPDAASAAVADQPATGPETAASDKTSASSDETPAPAAELNGTAQQGDNNPAQALHSRARVTSLISGYGVESSLADPPTSKEQ